MHHRNSTVVQFPARPPAASRAAAPSRTERSAAETSDSVRSAAKAGAAAAEAVVDILGAYADRDAMRDDMAASKAANLSVLWGAVLGVAKCHGQIPALAALEQVLERLHEDPHRLITEPQREAAEGSATRAVQALLKRG
ncbi:hypothetical protein [Rhodospirillaceae bacterium SYSU D60014]|uniref:hypothetical protein n=1 Tax=Virgifigura deserti TaxID=2268457 RepID=UPI000E661EC0